MYLPFHFFISIKILLYVPYVYNVLYSYKEVLSLKFVHFSIHRKNGNIYAFRHKNPSVLLKTVFYIVWQMQKSAIYANIRKCTLIFGMQFGTLKNKNKDLKKSKLRNKWYTNYFNFECKDFSFGPYIKQK